MKKGGLSLFLALALCLTLLPAAAFADSESETSTPHTHYLCGNGETCSHLGGHNEDSKTTFATAITQNNDGYVWGGGDCTQNQPNQCVLSNGGTYYPASDLVLEAPLNAQFGCIQIDGNVTLCLNGHTITVKANREAFKITKYGSTSSSTLTLTDCQGGGKITHDPSFLGNSVNLSEDCNFIMYGGSITGNSVASSGGGVCVYGAMTVSGSVRITGNVNDGSKGDNGIYTGGTASNVCLVGSTTITINGPLTYAQHHLNLIRSIYMTKCLLTLSNWIQKFLQGILLIIGTLLTAVNIAQIVGREIHFSLPWSEQLSTWLLIWTIFLGYHLVIKNDAELTIDAIHFKNHTAQLLLEILRDFLSLTMIVVFLIASTQFLQNSMIYPQKLSSMPVNMYVIYMVMPVSFALMALQKLTNMVVRIGNIVKPDALENTVDKGGQAK